MPAYDDMSLVELIDLYEEDVEILNDIESQHLAEVALCGDSWPGALLDIQAARERIARLGDAIQRRASLLDY